MGVRAVARQRTETQLQGAAMRMLRVHYHARFDIAQRGLRPDGGARASEQPQPWPCAAHMFIGVAEETGIIVELGEWVLSARPSSGRWRTRFPASTGWAWP